MVELCGLICIWSKENANVLIKGTQTEKKNLSTKHYCSIQFFLLNETQKYLRRKSASIILQTQMFIASRTNQIDIFKNNDATKGWLSLVDPWNKQGEDTAPILTAIASVKALILSLQISISACQNSFGAMSEKLFLLLYTHWLCS